MPLAGANASEIMAGLKRSAVYLKGRVAQMVELRQAPTIVFAFDSAFDTAARISTLLARPEIERDLHPPPLDPNPLDPNPLDNDETR
jgi:ribosome-binding factor A